GFVVGGLGVVVGFGVVQPYAQPAFQQPGWPQGYQQQPQQPGYPQAGAQPAPQAMPSVSERGRMALDYLSQHESCGPTELTQQLGFSGPTWSRELSKLVSAGYLTKSGQKYTLTAVGRGLV
ncbi:MAG: hypothetical protein Q4B45_02720, partial [Coriobacteriia bacterium]|nr:hypothetical protein [Coriobacteriia bacterium]